MKNILPHIVIYEKTTLDKNIIWDVQHDVRQISKNLQILRSKKAYGLKISQSIIFITKNYYGLLLLNSKQSFQEHLKS